MRHALFALLITTVLGACAINPAERTYTGIYAEGLETMTFQPDGREETWAVAGGDGVYSLQAAAPRAYPTEGGPRASFRIRATIRGEVSRPGRYGHLGLFRRQITITEVLEAVPADAN